MDERSENLLDQSKEVGSSSETMRGQRMELQTIDGEECASMEWFSFQTLNETFGFEEGPEGCWIDFKHNTGFTPAWNKGIPHTEETKRLIGEKSRLHRHSEETKERMRGPRGTYKKRKPITEEQRRSISERQKGKKRGPYKTSVVRQRDDKGRFLPDK